MKGIFNTEDEGVRYAERQLGRDDSWSVVEGGDGKFYLLVRQRPSNGEQWLGNLNTCGADMDFVLGARLGKHYLRCGNTNFVVACLDPHKVAVFSNDPRALGLVRTILG